MTAPVRVLVADDDPDARDLLSRGLAREGMEVVLASDGGEALRAAKDHQPDVLVLDIEMPVLQGYDVIESLRDEGIDSPIIVVSGRSGEGDRILGLDLGADDYVVKPVSPRELAARIRAVLRRSMGQRAAPRGPLQIDRPARRVVLGGHEVALAPREFDLLAALTDVPGTVLSRDELLRIVWGSDAAWQSRSTLIEHVRRLRAKLDAVGPAWGEVVNVRAVGYRYDPPPDT